jgi:hypothetical protein
LVHLGEDRPQGITRADDLLEGPLEVVPGWRPQRTRQILSERRFHGTSLPRPFHGVLAWLGDRLHFVVRGWDWLAAKVGGAWILWVLVGGLVLALVVLVATRLALRRAEVETIGIGRRARARGEDPAELERLADEAERRGDLEVALRLRFRAGLLRLGRARALPLRPSLRTREARRALGSARFDRLARDFDEVVYGGRPPREADVETARSEWPQVVAEARR